MIDRSGYKVHHPPVFSTKTREEAVNQEAPSKLENTVFGNFGSRKKQRVLFGKIERGGHNLVHRFGRFQGGISRKKSPPPL
jgi:hypothetical protein